MRTIKWGVGGWWGFWEEDFPGARERHRAVVAYGCVGCCYDLWCGGGGRGGGEGGDEGVARLAQEIIQAVAGVVGGGSRARARGEDRGEVAVTQHRLE